METLLDPHLSCSLLATNYGIVRVFWFRRKCVGSRVDVEMLSGLFNFAFIVASLVW